MRSPLIPLFRSLVLVAAGALPLALVHGQNAPQATAGAPDALQNQEQSTAPGRDNQKIEHIHVEDSGAKVDEVRYGGQTQSITVTPKANVPSYQVLPDNARAGGGQAESGTHGGGARVWNVLKF